VRPDEAGARSARAQRERRRARGGSTDTAALATARSGAPGKVTTVPYEGLAGLPAFNPDHDGERVPEAAAELRRQIAAADAVPFCPPQYAGSLPRSLKDLRLDGGGGEIYGKPVAWISVAAEGRGMGAHDALASVPGYLGATVIETACRRIPVARRSRAGRDSGRSALPVRGSRSMAGPPRPHQRPLTHPPAQAEAGAGPRRGPPTAARRWPCSVAVKENHAAGWLAARNGGSSVRRYVDARTGHNHADGEAGNVSPVHRIRSANAREGLHGEPGRAAAAKPWTLHGAAARPTSCERLDCAAGCSGARATARLRARNPGAQLARSWWPSRFRRATVLRCGRGRRAARRSARPGP